jgi:hypothetical protein
VIHQEGDGGCVFYGQSRPAAANAPGIKCGTPQCRAQVLSLQEFSRYRLPSPRFPSHLYREVFSFESQFRAAVKALETIGYLKPRPDHSYRIWDGYRVLGGLICHAEIAIPHARPDRREPGGSILRTNVGWLPDVRFSFPNDERWWEAAEAVNQGLGVLWDARHLRQVTGNGKEDRREETDEEFRARIGPLQHAIEREIAAIAGTLPAETTYWKERLAQHADLVIELRWGNFTSFSRLCSWQLGAATRLAEVRLGQTRRHVRSLVGRVNADLTAPALSAASSSVAQKAFDRALDELEEALPPYNQAVGPRLQLTTTDCEDLLTFLDESGLQTWFTELSIVSWDSEQFWDRTYDDRVGLVYGRVRTLAGLLEEALLAMAERTGNTRFRDAVESKATLCPRLEAFVRGPSGRLDLVNLGLIRRLRTQASLKPPFSGAQLSASLSALGMYGGNPAPTAPAPTAEQLLAGLIFVRNVTSHRYPILLGGFRVEWFETWGGHLPAINRHISWAALLLWGMSRRF